MERLPRIKSYYLRIFRVCLMFVCRINAVSNGQVRGDSYSEGCLGQTGTGARAVVEQSICEAVDSEEL